VARSYLTPDVNCQPTVSALRVVESVRDVNAEGRVGKSMKTLADSYR
jgi:hypothetical protein